MMKRILFATAATVALIGSPAMAETMNMKADLAGSSEVPPVTTSAKGNLTATYDTASKKLSWKGTVSGLSGEATAAHFHGPAEPGKNAGVLVPAPGVKDRCLRGFSHPDGRPGQGADGRTDLLQHPHRCEPARRSTRTGHKVS